MKKPKIEKLKLVFKESTSADTLLHLKLIYKKLSDISESEWNGTTIKKGIELYTNTLTKRGPALHPLRYSLSGRDKSPDPFTIAYVLGKKETLDRITFAIELLES